MRLPSRNTATKQHGSRDHKHSRFPSTPSPRGQAKLLAASKEKKISLSPPVYTKRKRLRPTLLLFLLRFRVRPIRRRRLQIQTRSRVSPSLLHHPRGSHSQKATLSVVVYPPTPTSPAEASKDCYGSGGKGGGGGGGGGRVGSRWPKISTREKGGFVIFPYRFSIRRGEEGKWKWIILRAIFWEKEETGEGERKSWRGFLLLLLLLERMTKICRLDREGEKTPDGTKKPEGKWERVASLLFSFLFSPFFAPFSPPDNNTSWAAAAGGRRGVRSARDSAPYLRLPFLALRPRFTGLWQTLVTSQWCRGSLANLFLKGLLSLVRPTDRPWVPLPPAHSHNAPFS